MFARRPVAILSLSIAPLSVALAQQEDIVESVVLEIPNGAKVGPDFDVDKATDLD